MESSGWETQTATHTASDFASTEPEEDSWTQLSNAEDEEAVGLRQELVRKLSLEHVSRGDSGDDLPAGTSELDAVGLSARTRYEELLSDWEGEQSDVSDRTAGDWSHQPQVAMSARERFRELLGASAGEQFDEATRTAGDSDYLPEVAMSARSRFQELVDGVDALEPCTSEEPSLPQVALNARARYQKLLGLDAAFAGSFPTSTSEIKPADGLQHANNKRGSVASMALSDTNMVVETNLFKICAHSPLTPEAVARSSPSPPLPSSSTSPLAARLPRSSAAPSAPTSLPLLLLLLARWFRVLCWGWMKGGVERG